MAVFSRYCKKYIIILNLILCTLLIYYMTNNFSNRNELIKNAGNYHKEAFSSSDLSDLSDDEFYDTWDAIIKKRNEINREICDKNLGQSKWRKDNIEIYRHRQSRLGHCGHGKVGSSTWVGIFYSLSEEPIPPQVGLHSIGWQKYKPATPQEKWEFDSYLMVTNVRHPYTRLVSSYRDRSFDHVEGQMMPKNRGDISKWEKIAEEVGFIGVHLVDCPTFSEYVAYIINDYKKCRPTDINCVYGMNPHWRPLYPKCNGCTIDYDVISKLETFSEDIRYIKLRLSEVLQHGKFANETQLRITKNALSSFEKSLSLNKSKGISTDDLAIKLFAALTDEEKEQIREIYKTDLLMYNYDPHLYH